MTTTPDTLTPPDVEKPQPDEWEPDIRWFHPVLAALALYSLGFLPHWMNFPGLVMAPTGAALTVAAVIAARTWIDEDTYGARHEKQATHLVVVAGIVATGWLVYADGNPSNPTALGLLALWTVTFGAVYALFRSKEPERKRERDEKREEQRVEHEAKQHSMEVKSYRELWNPWLAKAGLEGVTVDDYRETKAGYTLTLVDDPADGKVATFTDLVAALDTLVVLASRHYARRGIEIAPHQLRAEETSMAHAWLLHVSTKQPLKQPIPHPGPRPVASITEPLNPGIYEDGEPIELTLYGSNAVMVGGTGSGKSVFTHNVIAGLLACDDVALWIGGVKKMLPLIGPWLHPWLTGQTTRPVFDRIAGEDPEEVLMMLANFYEVVTLHNRRMGWNDKRTITRDDPAIILIIDEATSLARIGSKADDPRISTFDGRVWTASELLSALCEMNRSAGDTILFLTQYGLVDALGNHGTNTMRNIMTRIAGRTNSAHDGYATLNGLSRVDTTKLRDNTLMVQPNQEEPRAIPAKAYALHKVEDITRLAAAYTDRRPNLPGYLVRALEDDYTDRWNPARQTDLRDFLETQGLPYPHITPDVSGVIHLGPHGDATATNLIEPPVHGTLSPEGTPNSDPDTPREGKAMTTATTNDKLAALPAQARAAVAVQTRKLEVRSAVLGAVMAKDAPAWCPAPMLALAAKLVDIDAPADEQARVTAEVVEVLSGAPYDLPPQERDGTPGWARDELFARLRQVIAEEGGIELPAPGGSVPAEMRAVVDAVADLADTDLIRISELGRRVGAVSDGEQARLEAGRFGQSLRQEPWNLPESAFKRTAEGNAVRVGALRRAVA